MKTGTQTIIMIIMAAVLASCSESTAPPSEPATAAVTAASAGDAPAGQLNKSVLPTAYRIELRIDPREDEFSGIAEIDITLEEPRDQLWLHGKNLQVSEAWLSDPEGKRTGATYEQKLDSGVALLTLDEAVAAGAATLHFIYTAPFNRSSNGLFKVVRGQDAYAATQFQPIAARQVFPGFDDPGFKVPFDLALVARAGDVAITNTPELESRALDDGFVRWTFETTRPLPTYLLAFAVGPYDLVDHGMIPANRIRDREVALRGVAARGLGPRMEYALENTDGLLTALEEYFGTAYPYRKLDIIAVPESFGGAMENVGAIVYDEWLVLLNEDPPLDQRRAYTAVHAHELAHMWFGNLVTPKWWTDIWLNESFATWMMYKTADAYWPEGQFARETLKGALGAMDNDSLAAARQIREPIEDNDRISGAFDGITYQKGGGVLAMLERYVGEEGFRKGIQLHMERHADGTADANEFIASVAEGSGAAEIDAAFKSFIEQPGVPLVNAEVICGDGEKPRLEVSQSRYAPLGSSIDTGAGEWLIPMCVSYDGDGGRKSTCAMLRESRQTITLDSEACPSQLHPNADGAGYYRFAMEASWLDALVDGSSSLPASEALVLADSLNASFRAGEAGADSFVTGMATLINHPDWDVAEAAMGHLENITGILDAGDMALVYPGLQNMVKPRYEQLAGAEDEASKLLQQRMQRFLIVIARDQELRRPLADQAAARIGLNGDADPSAVPVDQMETILSVGVQDLGEPFFDLLLEQGLASEDPEFRNSAFGSLARVEDPELVVKLQSALLEGRFKGSESVGIVFRQMVRKATTGLTWEWIRNNDEVVIEMIPESFRSNTVPALGSSFCSMDKAAEWEAFVDAHADMIPGYERNLDQAVETIQLCAALKSARSADLLAALSKQ